MVLNFQSFSPLTGDTALNKCLQNNVKNTIIYVYNMQEKHKEKNTKLYPGLPVKASWKMQHLSPVKELKEEL